MPSIETHAQTSMNKTGKYYLELHEWIDRDPDKKLERHDINRIFEYGKMFQEKYGPEGLQEYLRHIHDDLAARFGHVREEMEMAIGDTLAYFGIKATDRVRPIGYSISVEDIDCLRRAGLSDKDIGHSIRVAFRALRGNSHNLSCS